MRDEQSAARGQQVVTAVLCLAVRSASVLPVLLVSTALTATGCGPGTQSGPKPAQGKSESRGVEASEPSEPDSASTNTKAPVDSPDRSEKDAPIDAPLAAELAARKAAFNAQADEQKKAEYERGIAQLRDSGILDRAKQVGDQAPDFELSNATGEKVVLSKLLEEGPVVIVWYRGGWCPYCNITLRGYGRNAAKFEEKGATLVAISPELPDNSLDTQQKAELDFTVLSDVGNKVADAYGVRFELPEDIAKRYNESFELNKHNGDDSNALPLAATYVIDSDGKIAWAFLSADYRERAEPKDVLAALDALDDRG